MKKTLFESFKSELDCLSIDEQAELLNRYYQENEPDNLWYDLDEEFFEMFYATKPYEAAYAAVMGEIDFNDKYIRMGGDGFLQSGNSFDIASELEDYSEEIFKSGLWEKYFTLDEEEEEEEE
jgi:hypothetical protein